MYRTKHGIYDIALDEPLYDTVEEDDSAYAKEKICVEWTHKATTYRIWMQRWQEEAIWNPLPLDLKLKQVTIPKNAKNIERVECEDGSWYFTNKKGKSEAAKTMAKFIRGNRELIAKAEHKQKQKYKSKINKI